MAVFAKYLVLQVPGWVILGFVASWARAWLELPGWVPAAVVGALVLKDLALYPWLRHAYGSEASRHVGAERLIGARGVTADRLDPEGYVRIGSELWQAECEGAGPIDAGARVRVSAVQGLTLRVRAE